MNRLPILLAAAIACSIPVAVSAGDPDPASTCGRISVFDAAPRGRHLYPAILIAVDGNLPGPTEATSFRMEPGRHVLTVAENIDAAQFSSLPQFERGRAGRERYKTLEVDVQPGITYRLAAQFNIDQRASIKDNAYWTPVVWSEIAESCR